jgi:hypothetical protein
MKTWCQWLVWKPINGNECRRFEHENQSKRLIQETQSCSACLTYLEGFDDCKIQCYRWWWSPHEIKLNVGSFYVHVNCSTCKAKGPIIIECPKGDDVKPKCTISVRFHVTNMCGMKCSHYGMYGHLEDGCWKKPNEDNGQTIFANFLEIMMDDEITTLK